MAFPEEGLPKSFEHKVRHNNIYYNMIKGVCCVRGGQSVTKDIHPDPRLHYFHRPENPRNVGYGYPKFISLSILLAQDSEFVENGAIFLRCRIFD